MRVSGFIITLWICLGHPCGAQQLTIQEASRPPGERRGIGSLDDSAIGYDNEPFQDRVGALGRRVTEGKEQLSFDAETGYLKATLASLGINTSSQMLVYS
ncbi:MAG TPA: hypothetical protein VN645_05770, partial [Steroidobacteraceae bacterium]|nr:hypothetical protein [Steroidobacteraceae bacterium]